MMLPLAGGPPARRALRSRSSSSARFGDEATLFRLGSAARARRPWFDRKPLWPGERGTPRGLGPARAERPSVLRNQGEPVYRRRNSSTVAMPAPPSTA